MKTTTFKATTFKATRFVIGTFVALHATGAFSGDYLEEGLTLTPMLGYMTFDEDKQGVDNASTASFAVGYQFGNPWAVELAYQGAEPEQTNGSEADSEHMRLDSLYHFGASEKIQPYAVFGLIKSDLEGQALDIDEAALNTGLGLKFLLNDTLALRTDVRAIQYLETDTTEMAMNLGFQMFLGDNSNSASSGASTASTSKSGADSDGDGVNDKLDNCPNTPPNSSVDALGCLPKTIVAKNDDTDNDGVSNSKDKCPNTKAGAKVTADGCYKKLKEDLTVALNVKFANNSDVVNTAYFVEIKPVAEFMKKYPETKVVIEGHTDNRGSADYNKNLSQKRADAVLNVLVDNFGIDATRLSAIGYGEEKPKASNNTEAGRAENRRVEAIVKATIEKTVE